MEAKRILQEGYRTEKLFYADSHMRKFDAVVLSFEKYDEAYRTVLDSTAFFPEG